MQRYWSLLPSIQHVVQSWRYPIQPSPNQTKKNVFVYIVLKGRKGSHCPGDSISPDTCQA